MSTCAWNVDGKGRSAATGSGHHPDGRGGRIATPTLTFLMFKKLAAKMVVNRVSSSTPCRYVSWNDFS